MSKLQQSDKFLDLSDYGRLPAQFLVNKLKHTKITAIHITCLFGLVGLAAVICILNGFYVLAGILLIVKSIIDAADGEMARVKNQPSYTGRYLDSIFDIILNFLIFMVLYRINNHKLYLVLVSFFCLQLQGTLYNFYYVILRNISSGADTTSQIFENRVPQALLGESQSTVNFLFKVYKTLYGSFDHLIYQLDKNAPRSKRFSNWFMTLVSAYGLGFQLLIMAIFLWLGMPQVIIPFFIWYTILLVFLIVIRKSIF